MKLRVIESSIEPHFVDDFKPAVTESAQRVGVALVLLTVMVIVNVGPGTTRQTVLGEKMDGVPEMFVTRPARKTVATFSERSVTGAVPARHCRFCASPPKRSRSSPISESKRGAILVQRQVRNQTDHDRDEKRKAPRCAGDRGRVAFRSQKASALDSGPRGSWL